MRTLTLALLALVGCDSSASVDSALSSNLTGKWTVTTSLRDGISCSGQLELAETPSGVTGKYWCQDAGQGNVRITYGGARGTRTGNSISLTMGDWNVTTTLVTDTVTHNGDLIVGRTISAERL